MESAVGDASKVGTPVLYNFPVGLTSSGKCFSFSKSFDLVLY